MKLSSIVTPLLLTLTGIIGYLAIHNQWNYEFTAYGIFLFALVYILIFERVIPLKKSWKLQRSTLWTDLKHLFISTAVFDAFGKVLALSLAVHVQKQFFNTAAFWEGLPLVVTFIIANIVGEFLPYFYHRISHKGDPNSMISLLLWRIHAIHHLPTRMNWFKTNWMHPINTLLSTFLKVAPILLLGFSADIVFLVGIFHIVIAYLSHANIRTTKSFWDYLIVTPRVHHFHHSTKLEEAKNFSTILPFWDLVFGTYYNRSGEVNKVGVLEGTESQYPMDIAYLRQLSFPLTALKGCCGTAQSITNMSSKCC